VPEAYHLAELHLVIQALFDWRNTMPYCFMLNEPPLNIPHGAIFGTFQKFDDRGVDVGMRIEALSKQGIAELIYEYGKFWTVKLLILSYEEREKPVFCDAGEGAAPPESMNGPLRFKRSLSLLHSANLAERQTALRSLGAKFEEDVFNSNACNERLDALTAKRS
jgi:hypothetical protein